MKVQSLIGENKKLDLQIQQLKDQVVESVDLRVTFNIQMRSLVEVCYKM